MDRQIRELERHVKNENDPSAILALARAYLRGGQLLLDNDCLLYIRGVFEGNIFGCLAALQLFSRVLGQSTYVEEDADKHIKWFEYYSDSIIHLERNRFFESPDFHLLHEQYVPAAPPIRPREWQVVENLYAWNKRLYWRRGRARTSRNSIEWEGENGRDLAGGSKIEIYLDWGSESVLPSCRIIYQSPAGAMHDALCALNSKFFQHHQLPAVPPLQEVNFLGDFERIPLHFRGSLVMPTCDQLFQAYHRIYPGSTDLFYSTLDTNSICIRCPGCQTLYSVYDGGGDEAYVYCHDCHYTLVEPYADNLSQLRAFLAQYATHYLEYESGRRLPVYIPPDCSPVLHSEIVTYLEDKGALYAV